MAPVADAAIRVLIGVAAASAAVGVAALGRRLERRDVVKSPLDLTRIEGRVVLFSDAACARCDEARAALETIGASFEEVASDTHPGMLEAAGVTAVPLIVVRRPDGSEAGRIAGKVSLRRLRRLVRLSTG